MLQVIFSFCKNLVLLVRPPFETRQAETEGQIEKYKGLQYKRFSFYLSHFNIFILIRTKFCREIPSRILQGK